MGISAKAVVCGESVMATNTEADTEGEGEPTLNGSQRKGWPKVKGGFKNF